MNKSILHIALPVPLLTLFDYRTPETNRKLVPGVRVKVPFGKRELVGVLISVSNQSDCPPEQLKSIIDVIDDEPILSPLILTLGQKASAYYQHAMGEVIVGTLPKWVRQGRALIEADSKSTGPNDIRLLAELAPVRKVGGGSERRTGVYTPVHEDSSTESTNKFSTGVAFCKKSITSFRQTLTKEQEAAVSAITSAQGFAPFLLEGVTGSGKTEVYLQSIEHYLTQGQQALVLVPEIGLTPQTIERFEKRFSVPVVALHSNLTDKARFHAFCAAKNNEASIVIGTRSAIFLPFKKLGIIVVDEEHDISFKQQSGFRYSARDLAVWRAQMENIPVILGSATPSLESFYNANRGRYKRLTLSSRINQTPMPTLTLIDLKNKSLNAGMSADCLAAIQKQVEEGQQVMVFLNRRGFAPTLMCHACGYVVSCERCDARLTLHQMPYLLYCHHCEHRRAPPRICPACRKAELISIGQGTERVESALKTLFPSAQIVRIDRDTTRQKKSLEEKLAQAHSGEAQILIGTQMLAKGHHFSKLALVVILDVDGGLFSADFRATERMAQLILQVAGRAGRETAGDVILQTHSPTHPLLTCLLKEGYAAFAKKLLEERKEAMLPPFSYFALVKAEAVKSDLPHDFLCSVKKIAHLAKTKINCLGPVPAVMEKKAGKFRSHLLLQADTRQALQAGLSAFTKQIAALPQAKRVRWALDVDPLEV